MNSTAKVFLRYWLPALVWTCVVLNFSTAPYSSEHTGTILLYILQHTIGNISGATFDVIHAVVRKGAHVVEYGTLGLLYFRAFREGRFDEWRTIWARRAVAVALLTSGIDEFHQSFVPGRGSEVSDVLLDTAAAAIFLLVAFLMWRAQQRKAAPTADALSARR